jgi:two-component system sensor histidine kinase BaeS
MNRLWARLAGAFLLVVLVAVGAVALPVWRATVSGFRGYVGQQSAMAMGEDLAQRLEALYTESGSWDGIQDVLPRHGGGGQGRGMGGPGGGIQALVADGDGHVVAATWGEDVGRALSEGERAQARPLSVDGETVGWLVVETPGGFALDEAQTRFLEEVTGSVTLAAIGASALALAVSLGLAWQLTRPLRQLTQAARQVAAGELGAHVPIRAGGAEEAVELARAFNAMSDALAEGEALRRRMAADVAHELRTPVAVMRARLEGMLDGVIPDSAENIALVYDQALHLARLVDDLRTLTQAEAGQLPLDRRLVSPGELAEQATTAFEPLAQDAGITLTSEVEAGLPEISVDPDRIRQVLANLLANALRHTSEGGWITLRVSRADGAVRFALTNSGQTLTPEQAAHVFERFWRADESRQRDSGGAGLGLAISREMVNLHGGRMWVEVGEEQTAFLFETPASGDPIRAAT